MSWRVSITDGAALEEAEIRELWSFRLSIMRLKPQVPPEKDFAKFSGLCRQARRVMRLRDGRGRMGGSLMVLVHDSHFQSERYRLVVLEYGFLIPELRGRAVSAWAWLRTLFPVMHPPGVRVFLGGVGYPTGTLALDRLLGPLWLYGEPQPSSEQAQVLEQVVTHVAGDGWDPVSQQVEMNTLPPTPSQAWYARSERRALYHRYLQRCSRWQEGWTVPCVCEYSGGRAARALLGVIRRWWNHEE